MSMFFNRCGRGRENVCLLVSGVLPDAERSALEKHLAACIRCQKYYDEIKSTAMRLADWERDFLHVGTNPEVEERWAKEFQASLELARSRQATVVHLVLDWCHDMIWPCRRIWAGFAAVWLGVFAVDFSTRSIAMKSSRPPAEMVKAFLESEGIRVEPPKQAASPSRSERDAGNLEAIS
jgi:anti-sigma factor RsiW